MHALAHVPSVLDGPPATLFTLTRTRAVWIALIMAALAGGDARTALEIHVQITTCDWADNGPWLMGVKRLIEMTSKLGVTI